MIPPTQPPPPQYWAWTDLWGPTKYYPPLGRSYLVAVPSYMSCVLIILTRIYGWHSRADIDIDLSSMGPIFVVLMGPTLGFNILYWYQSFIGGSSIWCVDTTGPWMSLNGPSCIGPQLLGSSTVVSYIMCLDSLNWALWQILIPILNRWVQYRWCG